MQIKKNLLSSVPVSNSKQFLKCFLLVKQHTFWKPLSTAKWVPLSHNEANSFSNLAPHHLLPAPHQFLIWVILHPQSVCVPGLSIQIPLLVSLLLLIQDLLQSLFYLNLTWFSCNFYMIFLLYEIHFLVSRIS